MWTCSRPCSTWQDWACRDGWRAVPSCGGCGANAARRATPSSAQMTWHGGEYDPMRCVRTWRYKYIRNYQPGWPASGQRRGGAAIRSKLPRQAFRKAATRRRIVRSRQRSGGDEEPDRRPRTRSRQGRTVRPAERLDVYAERSPSCAARSRRPIRSAQAQAASGQGANTRAGRRGVPLGDSADQRFRRDATRNRTDDADASRFLRSSEADPSDLRPIQESS